MDGLINTLRSSGHRFNFFQAVSLLEEYYRKRNPGRDPLNSNVVRFIADKKVVFPASDIARISGSESGVTLAMSFLGLSGISSPLPGYWSGHQIFHEQGGGPLGDFLDMFNHRIYTLYYQAWKKYNALQSFRSSSVNPFTNRLAALAGVALPESESAAQELDPAHLRQIAFASLFAGRSRNKAGLQRFLSELFGGIPVTIHEWQPQRVNIPGAAPMGRSLQLGVNALCGTTVLDYSGKIRVSVGPLNRSRFDSFLPGSSSIELLRQSVRRYCADPLDFDIEITMQSQDLRPVVLGAGESMLGVTSSLGQSPRQSEVKAVVIAG